MINNFNIGQKNTNNNKPVFCCYVIIYDNDYGTYQYTTDNNKVFSVLNFPFEQASLDYVHMPR